MERVIREKHSYLFIWAAAAAGFMVLSVILLSAFLVAAAGGNRATGRLESFYRHELYELADSAYNLETAAAKLLVSRTGKDLDGYLADLDRHAYAAAECVSKLPVEPVSASRALEFLNRVSDYAKSDVTGYEDTAEAIYAAARRLNEAIGDVLDQVDGGMRLVSGTITLGTEYEGTGDDDLAENSIDYPELIYDGPFSDGRKPDCYKALDALEPITADEAVARFTELFAASEAKILGESSYPETFEIAGRLGNLPVYASVSKRGGMVINLFVNKTVAKIDLTEKDAEILAVEYAEHLGYKSLRPVWYNENAGIAYVNLAPEADGIVYYTDLVKVKIAMDDGTVMGLEATGYCLNHTDRTLSPVIDAETAESLVSDKLTVTSTRLCVIPDGENEAFCYEVAGTYKGLDYFVYVDAVRGEQVNILRVIDEGQGRLTI